LQSERAHFLAEGQAGGRLAVCGLRIGIGIAKYSIS
jgi:hypothetical protein